MSARRSALVVAPFWRQAGHVGVYRTDRFVRWLAGEGIRVVVLCAGPADAAVERDWGVEVTVRDPLGLYRDLATGPAGPPPRQPSARRRALAHHVLVPDPTIVWALRAATSRIVLAHCPAPEWVISSSPPESAHVAAGLLARRLGGSLIIDLRDGWLDDPLRSLLEREGVRRSIEARIERRLVESARAVFVTSPVWRRLLTERLPGVASRTVVLTNGYPRNLVGTSARGRRDGELSLLHAGRFAASRRGQSAGALLAALWAGRGAATPLSVSLIGALEQTDVAESEEWRGRFQSVGWSLRHDAAVPRDELFDRYGQADGLLLLAASRAAVPSKLFEYLPTRRPILAVTPDGSAVEELVGHLPQVFVVRGEGHSADTQVVESFLAACARGDAESQVPPEFSESSLARTFLETLGV